MYRRCRALAPRHRFRFNNPLYSIDSSLIDPSLQLFLWGHFALGKAAVKLHLGLDHGGYAKGSIVVCDKGYDDYSWYTALS